MRNKKILLLFPPQWTPISPYFAIPSLLGQLKSKGFCANALDLNIDFFNYILQKDKIKNISNTIKTQFENLKKEVYQIYSPSKKPSDYALIEQITMYRYNRYKTFLSNEINSVEYISNSVENALQTIRSEEFYEPDKLIKALNIVDRALNILSLPYTPTKIAFEGLINPFFKFNYESINYFVNDKKTNIFRDYFKEKTKETVKLKPDFIGISINSSSQIIPGLTLAKMLKEKAKAIINIGGNFFGRIADELSAHSDFFKKYAHNVSIEEGEGPIIELAKYVNNEIPIEKVPNLLYLKDKKVCKNEKMKPVKLSDMANMNLDDYDFKKYFAPSIVLPYQTSRGCYWGKCSFCDQDFGQNFNVKSSAKVIDEFIELKKKYNISNFEFIDESVSPSYLKELATKIIENKLEVQYFFDARLEKEFTSQILKLGYKSGLKMVLWGLESGSNKVMELINKGIDLDGRFEVLKNSSDAGIWNFAFVFFGFPSETVKDAQQTVEMLVKNKDIIHSYGRSVFTMGRHAKLAHKPEKYGITKIYPAQEEFSPNINFDCIGMNKQEMSEILEYCLKECNKAYSNPLWMYLRYREWLFLYISKYGTEKVKNFKLILEGE